MNRVQPCGHGAARCDGVSARGLRRVRAFVWMMGMLLWPAVAFSGGSRLNVVVVANQASTNSVELANYYCWKRNVPPEQLLRVTWTGGNIEWTQAEFQTSLLDPLLSFLNASGRSNQIHYVVLSMDFPFRITGSRANSTTCALFYGFKTGTKGLWNSYAGSEERFADAPPTNAPGYSFLATMMTAGSLDQARSLVDQGVQSDGSISSEVAWLDKSLDPERNRRYVAFDNAIFNARLCKDYQLERTNGGFPGPEPEVLGWQTGLANFSVPSNTFVPGAIADSMTSSGGVIFGPNSQTSLLEFIHAGASGSYGTVVEPQLLLDKFPDPMVYYYQSRGFSLAECYYQSLRIPLEGLLVGEPLAAPYRRGLSGGWAGVENGAVLQGTTNLSLWLSANGSGRTIERVDLFLDGRWHQTLTNATPAAGNQLMLSLNGFPVFYEVPTNATLGLLASNLAQLMNSPVTTNITKVVAQAYGDRIELQSVAEPLPDGVFEFVDPVGGTGRQYLAVLAPDPIPTAISALRPGDSGSVELEITENQGVGYTLEASPNLLDWVQIYTNASGGPSLFTDWGAASHQVRFYRLRWSSPPPPPNLQALSFEEEAGFTCSVTAPPGRPYLVQRSADLHSWSDILTNQLGGSAVFSYAPAAYAAAEYYRTRSAALADYSQITVMGQTPGGRDILRVQDGRQGDTVVWGSSNGVDWTPIYSHEGVGAGTQIAVGQEPGTAALLTTALEVASPTFLESTAPGRRKFSINGPVSPSTFLTLSVLLTNGLAVDLAVTNVANATNVVQFTQALLNAVNAAPGLQGADGVVAEDLITGAFGNAEFNLRARTGGRAASAIGVTLNGSAGLVLSPVGQVNLDENFADLRPRNHVFVRSGLTALAFDFPLETALLPDGHHELVAVGYEGSHVFSQTHYPLKVQVQNTALQAGFVLEGSPTNRPVSDTLQFTVTANTNVVSEILLWSTGGLISGATNESSAVFAVPGSMLGVGWHPFHATVISSNGLVYRTESLPVSLVAD